MNNLTPVEQIENAIAQHIAEAGEESELVTSWILLAETATAKDLDNDTRRTRTFSRGSVFTHQGLAVAYLKTDLTIEDE